MPDDLRSHPPSERRLGRLWAAGATPASPALVAMAVLLAMTTLILVFGPALWRGAAGLVRAALLLVARPEAALSGARALVLHGLLAPVGILAGLAAVALSVHRLQAGPRPSEPAEQLAEPGRAARGVRWSGFDAVRMMALGLLAVVGVAVTARAALIHVESFGPGVPMEEAVRELACAAGAPLLALVVASALLDTLLRRLAWIRSAWMTRRELEDELRESEGHPLTRRRRTPISRRRRR